MHKRARRPLRQKESLLFAFGSMLGIACAVDVVVGVNPVDEREKDAALDAVIVDAAADERGESSDADTGPPPLQHGALSVAARTKDWVVGGYQGGATGEEGTANLWVGRIAQDAGETTTEVADLFAGSDRAMAVAVAQSQNWAAAGLTLEGARRRAWVRAFAANDTLTWSTVLGDSVSASAEALAFAPSGNVIAAGIEDAPGVATDGWAASYGPDGTRAWHVALRTEWGKVGGSATPVLAAAVDALGRIYLGGFRTSVDGGAISIPTVVQLNAAGQVWGSASFPGSASGFIRSVIVLPDNSLVVCAQLGGSIGIARIDSSFVPSTFYSYGETDPLRLGGCALTYGGVVLAATRERATGPTPWLAKHELTSFQPLWKREPAVATPARLFAVAPGELGRALAVGRTEAPSRRFYLPVAP